MNGSNKMEGYDVRTKRLNKQIAELSAKRILLEKRLQELENKIKLIEKNKK